MPIWILLTLLLEVIPPDWLPRYDTTAAPTACDEGTVLAMDGPDQPPPKP